jgi:hypothetical protein
MTPQPSTATQPTAKPWAAVVTKATILLLLFSVAALATLAKNGQYYPKSDAAQHVSISTKMNVVLHSSAHLGEEPLQPSTRFFPPQPPLRSAWVPTAEPPSIPTISVTVSMQHRSPPRAFSYSLLLSTVDDWKI